MTRLQERPGEMGVCAGEACESGRGRRLQPWDGRGKTSPVKGQAGDAARTGQGSRPCGEKANVRTARRAGQRADCGQEGLGLG